MSFSSISLIKAGALALVLAIAGTAGSAIAAGGGGGGGTTSSSTSNGGSALTGGNYDPPVDCKKLHDGDAHPENWIYDANNKKCVLKTSMNDKALYQQGHDYALAGYYTDALDALDAIRDKHDAMVLTMIGYSTRKLGHTEEGIAIYHQALAIDPNNINTHEYLGEGYLAAGRVDLAELELDTLNKLCGVGCEQFQDLQKALLTDNSWH